MDRFEELKSLLLERAKERGACVSEYIKAYKAECIDDLMAVVRRNFGFCVKGGIIDFTIVYSFKEEFSKGSIFVNEDTDHGFCLIDDNDVNKRYYIENATVFGKGNCTIIAGRNASVDASGYVNVKARSCSYIDCHDNTTLSATGCSLVTLYDKSVCKQLDCCVNCDVNHDAIVKGSLRSIIAASGNSVVDAMLDTVVYASMESEVNAYDNSIVIATGESTVNTFDKNVVILSEDANIKHASDSVTVVDRRKKSFFKLLISKIK